MVDLASLLRRFVSVNRYLSRLLENAMPWMGPGMEAETRLHELLHRMTRDSQQHLRILEVGGIDRPLLEKSTRYEYVGLDIEYTDTCDEKYDRFINASIEEPLDERFDLIISKAVLEHVPDNNKAFRAMHDGLAGDGQMLHFIPNKNHPYALLARCIPSKYAKMIIGYIRPQSTKTGYPTFFHLCSPRQIRKKLNALGIHKVRIECFYSGSDYFAFFVPAFLLVSLFNWLCRELNVESLSSGMVIHASK